MGEKVYVQVDSFRGYVFDNEQEADSFKAALKVYEDLLNTERHSIATEWDNYNLEMEVSD